MSNRRKPLHWHAVVGQWNISGTKADYIGPDPGSPHPYGICVSNVDFSQGDVRLDVALPAPAPPDTSGRLLLGFRSENDVYYTIGVGGYGKAYTLARYEVMHGWTPLWWNSTESNLNNA